MEEMINLNEETVSLENASPLDVAKAIEKFLDDKKGRDISKYKILSASVSALNSLSIGDNSDNK